MRNSVAFHLGMKPAKTRFSISAAQTDEPSVFRAHAQIALNNNCCAISDFFVFVSEAVLPLNHKYSTINNNS